MRYCERCNGSLAKGQKAVHDRHGRWLCQPCHDEELREHKEKAEAHLREAHAGGGKGRGGTRLNPAIVVAVAVTVIGLAAFGWMRRAESARAFDRIASAQLEYYRGQDAALADRVAAMGRSERRAWELEALQRQAGSVDGWDPERRTKLHDAIHTQLWAQRQIFPDVFIAGDPAAPRVLVRSEWHALTGEEQADAVATLDRLISVLVAERVPWSLLDAALPVGGRRDDGVWSSKPAAPKVSDAGAGV